MAIENIVLALGPGEKTEDKLAHESVMAELRRVAGWETAKPTASPASLAEMGIGYEEVTGG